jgi:hypothetical protein
LFIRRLIRELQIDYFERLRPKQLVKTLDRLSMGEPDMVPPALKIVLITRSIGEEL